MTEDAGAGSETSEPPISGLLLDLDGTVYRGRHAVPGAPELILHLEAAGLPFLYVTNRSNRTAETICEQLRGYGLPCRPEQVLTSALGCARHLGRPSARSTDGSAVYAIGSNALHQALSAEGWNVVDESAETADTVVVGLDRTVTYRQIDHAARLVRDHGARFLATNPDKVTNADHGLVAGNGAIVAAVEAAAGRPPEMIGKPSPILFEQAREILGLPVRELLVVGDNLETDIQGGIAAGMRTALLLTGVSAREDVQRTGVRPDHVFSEIRPLRELVQSIATAEKLAEA